ncbi:MAG: substrate-binding domain-containing protein [Prevotella sp.]|nr:substrate-binding domain-containing protein [Prevotella sp.]
MTKNRLTRLMLLGICVLLASCSGKSPKYIIGVSQCSEDIWRNWQNSEMKMEANFHEDVELRFATAHDDSKLQSQQIGDLIESGIDLLIVAPNQRSSVSPAIDRAYDKGIPVIVFERKTDSRKYTAFVSADNYEMGRQMGRYVVNRLNGKGRVMEVLGLEGSSPAEERHKGFTDALKETGVEIVATIQGDWTETKAYEAVRSYKGDFTAIDLVFGHNDRSALGARKAFQEKMKTSSLPLFCGIDGLPGENGGIRQVRDSLLDASYIYPTRGDQLLQLALDILDGKPYEKETMLTSALVTPENAEVLFLESDEVMRQSQNLEKLQKQASAYLQQLDTQRTITLMALILIALLVLAMVLFWQYHRSKVSAQHERVINNLWNLEVPAECDVSRSEEGISRNEERGTRNENSQSTDNSATDSEEDGNLLPPSSFLLPRNEEPLFIVLFKKVVEARLADSDLSVDDLAAAMNLSRVQLYRKVKSISGSSPVELLRTARLNRGYQLLLTTGKNVSEVAYDVGFTAPSYFTKCFKDEFGVSPSDLQSK